MCNMKNLLLAYSLCIIFSPFVLAQPNMKANSVPNKPTKISSAFDPKNSQWDIAWPGRISQYDLVYKSPPVDPMQGIPLGNGDVAALVWCEGSKIIIVLNKCDLWDDSKSEKFETWNEKYDHYTTQRHAARIIIDFKFPVFNCQMI